MNNSETESLRYLWGKIFHISGKVADDIYSSYSKKIDLPDAQLVYRNNPAIKLLVLPAEREPFIRMLENRV